MVFPRVGPGWHLRSWKAVPVCQTRHQTHSRHGGTHEDYSLTGAQKSNSPGPCQPHASEDQHLLLTDGTLIERRNERETRHPWTRVEGWPITVDPEEAKELLERRAYQLAAHTDSDPTQAQAPIDVEVLAAYRSLKKWATRNGVQ
jgi:hypothetical protein